MKTRISVDYFTEMHKDHFEEIVHERKRALLNCHYINFRLQMGTGQGVGVEDGELKGSGVDYGIGCSVRVEAGYPASPGYASWQVGAADITELCRMLRENIELAHARALVNAINKGEAKAEWGEFGKSFWDMCLSPVGPYRAVVPAEYKIHPMDVSLEEIQKLAVEASKRSLAVDSAVLHNFVGLVTSISRELIITSEGTSIDQTFAFTQGQCFVLTQTGMNRQEHFDVLGHQRGWEILTDGIGPSYAPYHQFPNFIDFFSALTKEAADLSRCRPLLPSDKEVVVVTDPHYNTLKVHEIIGHPTEADRAVKMEAAYAGRTWLLRNLKDNQIGRQVASPLVSAFSDPALPGYGHYEYDHEGVKGRRVDHLDKGVLWEFMNSRQTAAVMGTEPNGSSRANGGGMIPLVRMSNTVFGPGQSDPADIIREVEHGYYFVGHRIPSISESRENFRISSKKVFEITNGELGEMFCNGAIMGDSRDYLMSVDAVGTDFELYPISNCGKGQPMQSKELGNGGPTMRSRARVVGESK